MSVVERFNIKYISTSGNQTSGFYKDVAVVSGAC